MFSMVGRRVKDSSQLVNVTFPDGYTDTMVLWNHKSNNEGKSDFGIDQECNYLGHLLNEKEACVAMTGKDTKLEKSSY